MVIQWVHVLWIWIKIAKPCETAIVATIFAEHFSVALSPDSWASIWLDKLAALVGLASITLSNCFGPHSGASAAIAFLDLKLLALSSIFLV